MPIGTRNMSPEQMAANLAAYKAKVAAKIEARKARATSEKEIDELTAALEGLSTATGMDDITAKLASMGLSMGGRRTRRNKSKGKKRGGDDPTVMEMDLRRCEEKVRELETSLSNLRAVMGVGGRKRTHKRKH